MYLNPQTGLRLYQLLIIPTHPSHVDLLLKCCFTSTETVGLLGTGAQDGHLDFHTAPGLYPLSLLLLMVAFI